MRPPARFAAALLLLLVGAAASAQEEPAKPPPDAEAEPTGPYPLGEVTLRAEEVRDRLRRVAEKLEPVERVEAIAQELPTQARLVRDVAAETRADLAQGSISLERLVDLEREWETRRNDINAWRDQITERGAEVDREIDALQKLASRWEATRAAAGDANATPVAELASTTLAEIRDAETLARARSGELLALRGELAKVASTATEALERVRSARTESRSRLLQADSPPLWALRPVADLAAARAQLSDDWRRDAESLVSYLELRRGRVLGQLLLFFAALIGGIELRRRLARRAEEDPALAETLQILRYPVSVALLVAILGGLWLHPLAPAVLGTLLGLLLLAPAVRLLPSLVDPHLRPAIYTLAAFYLGSEIRTAIGSAPLLARLLFTFEVVAGAAALLWLSRASWVKASRTSLTFSLRAALVLLGASFVANLFGYFGLAKVLGRGLLISAYSAAILYGGYRVGRAFVAALLHTATARRLRAVRVGTARIERWSDRLLRIGGALLWLSIVLDAFTLQQPVATAVSEALSAPVAIGSISFSPGDILLFAAVLGSAYVFSSFLRFVLEEDVFPRVALRRGVSNAVTTTLHYVILFFGLLLALGAAGVELGRVTLLAGAFGVGIGFGLQNIVNNFVSGLILLFERPIQVGDTIEVGGLMGEVRRIGARSSTVRTFDGAEVIVPNAQLISDQVVNWTLSDRLRRMTVAVGVAYGTDPDRVLAILREVANEDPAVLETPKPLTIFKGFGESSLDFELRYWIPRFEEGLVMQTRLLTAIERKLREAGIEIPFPQRDLHVRSVDDPAARALAGAPES